MDTPDNTYAVRRLVWPIRPAPPLGRHLPYRSRTPFGANSGIFGVAALLPSAASNRSRAFTNSMN